MTSMAMTCLARTGSRASPLVLRSTLGTPSSRRLIHASFFTGSPPPSKERTVDVHGAEGPHYQDGKPGSSTLSVPELSPLNGDWVLFHPVYTDAENKLVKVVHRTPRTLSDRFARGIVSLSRWSFDVVSGYRNKPIPENHSMSIEELRRGGYIMTPKQWLARILFLESIAGVPGMCAATIRHLQSLRLMRRDGGWIHTLLQEAENERMHLMTFMTLKKPSIFFRGIILGAQGVFYNLFFIGYLMSSKTAHRFVASLEEEAVYTYTKLIKELEAGYVPEWSNQPAPEIAREYWRLKDDAKLLDVIYAVRSDESTHRFVNHSLASLEPRDTNPFALREPDLQVRGTIPGFERDEAEAFLQEQKKRLEEAPLVENTQSAQSHSVQQPKHAL